MAQTNEDETVAQMLMVALGSTSTAQKVAADAMAIDQAQLSRWLAGQGHLTVAAALRLPEDARIEFFERVSEQAGAFVLPRLMVKRFLAMVGLEGKPRP